MKKYINIFFLVVTLLCNNIIIAQSINLVPNPSFEEYSSCPTIGGTELNLATPWNAACGSGCGGSSDFFHCCSTNSSNLENLSMQHPRTGCGESSIILYGNYDTDNYREYMEIKLNDSLIYGKKYCAKLYTNLNNYAKYAIENIGMHFSKTELFQPPLSDIIPVIPQIEYNNGYIRDTISWTKISGSFNANGGEQYLIIGNFHKNANTNHLLLGGTGNPRYFFDDVSVCACEDFNVNLGNDTTLCYGAELVLKPLLPKEADSIVYTWQDGSHAKSFLVKQPGIYSVSAYIEDYNITVNTSIKVNYMDCTVIPPTIWIPNCFTPNDDGLNDVFSIKTLFVFSSFNIKIYNRWAQQVFESNDVYFGWNGIFKGSPVPTGVYIYYIEATDQLTMKAATFKGRVTVVY